MKFVKIDNGSLNHPTSSAKVRVLDHKFLVDYCDGKDFNSLSAEEIRETLVRYDPVMYGNSSQLVHNIRNYEVKELRYLLSVRLDDAETKLGFRRE